MPRSYGLSKYSISLAIAMYFVFFPGFIQDAAAQSQLQDRYYANYIPQKLGELTRTLNAHIGNDQEFQEEFIEYKVEGDLKSPVLLDQMVAVLASSAQAGSFEQIEEDFYAELKEFEKELQKIQDNFPRFENVTSTLNEFYA